MRPRTASGSGLPRREPVSGRLLSTPYFLLPLVQVLLIQHGGSFCFAPDAMVAGSESPSLHTVRKIVLRY